MSLIAKRVTICMVLAVFMGSLMLAAGCHSAPGRSKKFGTYYEYMPGTVDHVTEAARQVLDEMGYMSKTAEDATAAGRLSYRASFGSDINVKVEPDGPNSVQVGVNINPGDSEGMSQNILKRIRERASGVR